MSEKDMAEAAAWIADAIGYPIETRMPDHPMPQALWDALVDHIHADKDGNWHGNELDREHVESWLADEAGRPTTPDEGTDPMTSHEEGGGMSEVEHGLEIDQQRVEWERFVRDQHAKGICDASGLRARSCVRSICDCFETEEGAAAMERGECACHICRPLTVACPCGCPADMHIGEIGCPCALPGEPPCAPTPPESSAQ